MKKYFFILLLFVQASFAIAQSKFDKEPYLTKSLSGESIKNVEATTSGGSISVAGVNASEARIEVYVSPNNEKNSLTKEELKQRLDEMYNLDIRVANNKLIAIAKSKEQIRDWKKALNIGFKIYVPQNASTNLTTSGGSISLSNLSGSQTFTTSGGSLHINKLSGKVNGRTSGGSIHLEDSRDEIDLTTSGGSIKASNSSGNLKLVTSGGSLDLTDLKGTINATTSGGSVRGKNIDGELKAHTSGGSVHLSDLSCSLETSTSGGNIDVAFSQVGKYVKINNSAGNIDITLPKNKGLDLDLSGRIANTHFEKFDGKIDENTVKGKLNGGGVPITIDASSGWIKIELK
ncbi:MAG: DUF4097 family beta strand repeat protein [Chitinophagaceae bacterium]|nr:DUF4097 family beta strand repeat protein [Chitinophagaceae bacterium]